MREAACLAVTEVYSRIAPEYNREAFRAAVPDFALALGEKLAKGAGDTAYGVRVQACLALGHIAKLYASDLEEAFGAEEMASVYSDCWLARLADPVASVREAAAIALIQCLPVLPAPLLDSLRDYISTNLLKAKDPSPSWELSDGCLYLVRELASA